MIDVAVTALALALGGGATTATALDRLERAVAPERPVLRRAEVTIGRSSEGRPITALARNGVRAGGVSPSRGPLILVFGCIHGDECAAIGASWRALEHGCPPPGDGLVVVPNLNPDGLALGTRLNARGVDLNRNFGFAWRAGGAPGDPEYPGPAPFSEPETGIARRLILELRPDITIWFHQQAEPLVRAWGPSVPAARAYARLAGLPFHRMPWMDGTAPNWQNHRFPGTSSFVVELPDAGPVGGGRQARAIFELPMELAGGRDG